MLNARLALILLPSVIFACGDAPADTDTVADTDTDSDTDSDSDSDTDTDTDADADPLVYQEGFESEPLTAGAYTPGGTIAVPGWTVYVYRDSVYDYPTETTYQYSTDGGVIYPSGTDMVETDPLAAPADGSKMLYITNYAGTYTTIRGALTGDPGVTIAAETAYELRVAVGRRAYYSAGKADVALYYTPAEGAPAGVSNATLVSDISDGGWVELSVPFDPPDSAAGRPLGVQLAFSSDAEGYTTVAYDNVRIYARPAAPN